MLRNCLYGVLIDKHSLTKLSETLTNCIIHSNKLKSTEIRPIGTQKHKYGLKNRLNKHFEKAISKQKKLRVSTQ